MPIVESELDVLRHPRLAALATSAWPAWLWSADGSQILWANAVGAALFGGANVSACEQRRFDARDATAAQIVRLAATLPAAAQERLERLRGFGSNFGRALTCMCSRIVVDGRGAVLVAAVEAAGPALTLGERVRRLLIGREGAIAAFEPDGTLTYANAAGQTRLSGMTTLSALGIDALVATALERGTANGTTRLGEAPVDITATRLGKDASRVLVLALSPQPGEATQPIRSATAPEVIPDAIAPAIPEAVAEVAPQTIPDATSDAVPDAIAEAIPEAIPEMKSEAIPEAIAAAAPPATSIPAAASTTDDPIVERRHPLRFVWQMDADGRFGLGSDEFIELVGPRTVAAFGRLWSEVAADLKLDPDNQVAQAVATRETWSGIVISWPADDTSERLPVELSGLPVFDRDRGFRGYRGFGVCRDIERINQLARARRERPIGFMPPPDQAVQPALTPVTPPVPDPTTIAEPAEAATAAPTPDRTPVSVAPGAANVLQFRPSPPPEPKTPPTLSPVERKAFRELAQELTARLRGPQQAPAAESDAEILPAEHSPAAAADTALSPAAQAVNEHVLLDRIPIGVLIYRHDRLLYANRHFLEWTGYENLDAIEAAGGLNKLFAEPAADALAETGGAQVLSILTHGGDKRPVEGRMFTVPWNGSSALALILTNGQAVAAARTAEAARGAAEDENRELRSILDTATDGIITLDAEGRVVAANARAVALFGKAVDDMNGRELAELFTAESERAARDYFDRVAHGTNVLDNVLEVETPTVEDQIVPLAMTIARIGTDKFSAVFRDATQRKQTEDDLRNAKRESQRAGAAKAEFLAKVSHEIRTPLNAITGFAEVIMAERFGPIGNERYREYIKDIHNAGTHLVAMLNDLLDLSKVESGRIDLNFANVNLNELTRQCVGIMQPQANRARIIIRTSLTPTLPRVVADERSLRQIVLNLLSNSIRFTGPGGQVIVSTVFSDAQEAVLRVRDTGVGMSEKDIQAALEPFQQTATSGSWGSGGTGFGLPLTKALAEANRANFSIKSAPNAGTLVEIGFPPSRIVAD
jgi:PAS domain S-box-containing protein